MARVETNDDYDGDDDDDDDDGKMMMVMMMRKICTEGVHREWGGV